jgi:hypothetical protein
MDDQSSPPQPVSPTPEAVPGPNLKQPIGMNLSGMDVAGLVAVTLFIGALLIPSAGVLGVPLFIIGTIVAARILKDAAKISPNARVAVKFFKVMAGIGIAIVAAIIGLIMFFVVMLSHADVGS